jgi:DNA-binding NtrC family response regulator
MTPATQASDRPRLLFVDDEQRVLNSMRIMFRRQFDLFLASHGAEALDIVKDKDIDVIVADHRMPKMTGVEVLSKVRTLSPRTVRILLTGYADLDAVEGSINESEVFRFLTKPCAPKQLRETIELAAKLARETPAPEAPTELSGDDTLEIVMESDTVREIVASQTAPAAAASAPPGISARTASPTSSAPAAPNEDLAAKTDIMEAPRFPPAAQPKPEPVKAAPRPKLASGLGIVVFSTDQEVLDTVQRAVRGRLPVYHAGNIVQVVKTLTEHRPGVLVTDVSEDKATIQSMTARLKEHLPELVTIAVSQHRDVLDMVWLINHGQIFRFLRKPLSEGRCAISLQAALQHHRMLLKNPELIRRHEVDATADSGLVDGVLAKLKNVRRLWA